MQAIEQMIAHAEGIRDSVKGRIDRPKPQLPPVTMATFPFRSIVF